MCIRDSPVARVEDRITKAVSHGRRLGRVSRSVLLVAVAAAAVPSTEWLAHGLPGRRPEVAIGIVAKVDEAAGLVQRHAVEAEARHASLAAGLVERVAPSALRDDAAVQARAQVVGPRTGGVRASDDVLAGGIVKVAVLHENSQDSRHAASLSGLLQRRRGRALTRIAGGSARGGRGPRWLGGRTPAR